MESHEKRTRQGNEYIIVEDDDGTEYYFSAKGDGYSPSTLGATDEEGLTEACDYLSSEGYEIVMGRMRPAGFEYDG
jgi:hypothetical protein